jgi:hypothetical protein
MEKDGTHGRLISHAEAKQMMDTFKAKFPAEKHASHQRFHFARFSTDLILKLASTPGCVCIDWHHGHHTDGSETVIGVPVDAAGNTIGTTALQFGTLCPPFCPPK